MKLLLWCLIVVGVSAVQQSPLNPPSQTQERSLEEYVPSALVSETETVQAQGFDWGNKCDEGTGSFEQAIKKSDVVTVGDIPAGKYNVYIRLESSTDVDIQLFHGSKAIVKWPDGLLKGSKAESTTYNGVKYVYSGYNGENGQKGHEYIKIEGTTNVPLVMKAFGYEAGSASVSYKWARPVCCCTTASGQFQQPISNKATRSVGVIPAGLGKVQIDLKSSEDVDIQLIDVATSTPVVAWPNGLLKGSKRESRSYEGDTVVYSGYNGQDGKKGWEYITLDQTSRKYEVRAYGYQAGEATVTYSAGMPSCCGNQGWKARSADAMAQSKTQCYKQWYFSEEFGDAKCVVRRGSHWILDAPASQDLTKCSVFLGNAQLDRIPLSQAWDPYKVQWKASTDNGPIVKLYFPSRGSIGRHDVHVSCDGGAKQRVGRVWIIFNPYHSSRTESCKGDTTCLQDYLERQDGRVWYGDTLNGLSGAGSMAWNYHACELLDDVFTLFEKNGGFLAANDPKLVVRQATWVGNNAGGGAGLLYGRWDGNYADGKKPTYWDNSRAIFKAYIANGHQPVRYGQCWVFSSLGVTIFRALGIASRSLTNFRSAHERDYDLMVTKTDGESIWNFHVWNEVFLDGEWNACDLTPQERSEGRYQCGPAPLSQIHAQNMKAAFDVAFVTGEVAAASFRSETPDRYSQWKKMRWGHHWKKGVDYDDQDVGRYISSMKPGCTGQGHTCRLDRTTAYKKNAKWFSSYSFREVNVSVPSQPLPPPQDVPLQDVHSDPLFGHDLLSNSGDHNDHAGLDHPLLHDTNDIHDPFLQEETLASEFTFTVDPPVVMAGESFSVRLTYDGPPTGKEVRVSLKALLIMEDGTLENLPKGDDCAHPLGSVRPTATGCECNQMHQGAFCDSSPTHCCCKQTTPAAKPTATAAAAPQAQGPKLVTPVYTSSCSCEDHKQDTCKEAPDHCCCGGNTVNVHSFNQGECSCAAHKVAEVCSQEPSHCCCGVPDAVKPSPRPWHAQHIRRLRAQRDEHYKRFASFLEKSTATGDDPTVDPAVTKMANNNTNTTTVTANVTKTTRLVPPTPPPPPPAEGDAVYHDDAYDKLTNDFHDIHLNGEPAVGLGGSAKFAEHGRSVEIGDPLAELFETITLDGSQREWTLTVHPEDYENELWRSSTVRVRGVVVDAATEKRVFHRKNRLTFVPPVVEVVSSCSSIATDQPFLVYLRFDNPFDVALTDVTVDIDAPGDDNEQDLSYGQPIPALGRVALQSKPLVFSEPGDYTITVSITSCQYSQLYGDLSITVADGQRVDGTLCEDVQPQQAQSTKAATPAHDVPATPAQPQAADTKEAKEADIPHDIPHEHLDVPAHEHLDVAAHEDQLQDDHTPHIEGLPSAPQE